MVGGPNMPPATQDTNDHLGSHAMHMCDCLVLLNVCCTRGAYYRLHVTVSSRQCQDHLQPKPLAERLA